MSTLLITTIDGIRASVAQARQGGRAVACVPTMGALHAGHAALIERAHSEAGLVVVTIFVNPTQFDNRNDFDKYTRNLDADLAFCAARNVDLVFAPPALEMYPGPSEVWVDAPELARHLCGAFRPGHFRGVATVVAKLFNIVQPDLACFGEKDAQQLAIIRRLVKDLNFPIRIIPVPTVREPDDLALSSRNRRLTPEERKAAPLLYQALLEGRHLAQTGQADAAEVERAVVARLEREPSIRVEYVRLVDANRMQPVDLIAGDLCLAAAVWLGNTRLIDNVFLSSVISPAIFE